MGWNYYWRINLISVLEFSRERLMKFLIHFWAPLSITYPLTNFPCLFSQIFNQSTTLATRTRSNWFKNSELGIRETMWWAAYKWEFSFRHDLSPLCWVGLELHLIRHALLPKMHTLKLIWFFFSIFSGHISRMCTLFFSIGRGLSGGIGIRPCQKRQQSEGCTKSRAMLLQQWQVQFPRFNGRVYIRRR